MGFGEQGQFFSGGQGNKDLKIRGTQAILGHREYKKSRFCFWGTRPFFQGNRYPPWEGLTK